MHSLLPSFYPVALAKFGASYITSGTRLGFALNHIFIAPIFFYKTFSDILLLSVAWTNIKANNSWPSILAYGRQRVSAGSYCNVSLSGALLYVVQIHFSIYLYIYKCTCTYVCICMCVLYFLLQFFISFFFFFVSMLARCITLSQKQLPLHVRFSCP